jgi:hypothetical protein
MLCVTPVRIHQKMFNITGIINFYSALQCIGVVIALISRTPLERCAYCIGSSRSLRRLINVTMYRYVEVTQRCHSVSLYNWVGSFIYVIKYGYGALRSSEKVGVIIQTFRSLKTFFVKTLLTSATSPWICCHFIRLTGSSMVPNSLTQNNK